MNTDNDNKQNSSLARRMYAAIGAILGGNSHLHNDMHMVKSRGPKYTRQARKRSGVPAARRAAKKRRNKRRYQHAR